jgi:membrane carboxypeptidase/penicillin-binding protein
MASTPAPISLTITLPADVATALHQAAAGRGWTSESLAADCVAQQIETAIRHRVVLERIEQVDGALIEMATALGAIEAAGGGGIDLSDFCRYRKAG